MKKTMLLAVVCLLAFPAFAQEKPTDDLIAQRVAKRYEQNESRYREGLERLEAQTEINPEVADLLKRQLNERYELGKRQLRDFENMIRRIHQEKLDAREAEIKEKIRQAGEEKAAEETTLETLPAEGVPSRALIEEGLPVDASEGESGVLLPDDSIPTQPYFQ